MRPALRSLGQHAVVVGLGTVLGCPRLRPTARLAAGLGLVVVWTRTARTYRRVGRDRTKREFERLRTAEWSTYTRHYNERVPTIEEEFDIWGEYHQHRHEMRYDLVADAVRQHLPAGGRVLDLGCGSALVADRIRDLDAAYVGVDFGGHHIDYAEAKYRRLGPDLALRAVFARAQGERLPFPDGCFDVVVMSEVIEHLLRPEDAVWEVSRVLRPGGVHVMTTNNASEMPLRSPLVNPAAWLEKGVGFRHPQVVSCRPWIWPEPMHPSVRPDGVEEVYLPHTHHLVAETALLYRSAGLDTFAVSTFEFPPAQSRTAALLDRSGEVGRRVVDAIEAVATRTPFVRRMGAHLLVLARKQRPLPSPTPPPGSWPGPFS